MAYRWHVMEVEDMEVARLEEYTTSLYDCLDI